MNHKRKIELQWFSTKNTSLIFINGGWLLFAYNGSCSFSHDLGWCQSFPCATASHISFVLSIIILFTFCHWYFLSPSSLSISYDSSIACLVWFSCGSAVYCSELHLGWSKVMHFIIWVNPWVFNLLGLDFATEAGASSCSFGPRDLLRAQ